MPNMQAGITINGRAIQLERLRKGLTLRDLAARCAEHGCAVEPSVLSRTERGSQPSPRLLPALAAALGLDVDDLLVIDDAA